MQFEKNIDCFCSFIINLFLSFFLKIFEKKCRAIRRLDELMSNLKLAAEVVGDAQLAQLFEASRETLRRGLPFAASLYI